MKIQEDMLILVDNDDNVIGHKTKTKCHEGEGLLHRAFSIFLFNQRGQLLLQKRSTQKLLWPLHWSNSVCSHPRKGERHEEAARRRLMEELGVTASFQFIFKFQYQAIFKDAGAENEMCSVYFGRANGTLRVNELEIEDLKYMTPEEIDRGLQENSARYTPWFALEWQQIRSRHLGDIERLLS